MNYGYEHEVVLPFEVKMGVAAFNGAVMLWYLLFAGRDDDQLIDTFIFAGTGHEVRDVMVEPVLVPVPVPMSVLVLEQSEALPEKACGEGLMPGAVQALASLGIELTAGRAFRGVRFSDASHAAHADFRTSRGHALRRSELMRALCGAATRAGVEIGWGHTVREFRVQSNAYGAQYGRNDATTAVTQDVRRCDNNPAQATPAYWDVTYQFRGKEHHVQMANPPGRTVTVNRAGEPRV